MASGSSRSPTSNSKHLPSRMSCSTTKDLPPSNCPPLPPGALADDAAERFAKQGVPGPVRGRLSSISFLDIARLDKDEQPVILACDMTWGLVMARPLEPTSGDWTILSNQVRHPAQAVVADLDADGLDDLIVADLGVPMPSDERKGQVVWLKRLPDGQYETRILMKNLGRVCDARPADFDADGDLDLVVAEFGWHTSGTILLLENRAQPGQEPTFEARVLDPRHGTIHVPVADLDQDGRPDFVALISQEFEAVVAFLNRGDGQFETQTLFDARHHPAFGSSGIDLVDFDGDEDLDVLLTNGDVYDSPLLKPYHGVSWLENRGSYPFTHHAIGPLYGADRARRGRLRWRWRSGCRRHQLPRRAHLWKRAFRAKRRCRDSLRADIAGYVQTSHARNRHLRLRHLRGRPARRQPSS